MHHSPRPPALRWGGDSEGGAPYVEADAEDPLLQGEQKS